jgi:hypothetical protein
MAPPGSNKRMGAKAVFVPRFCHHDTQGSPSIFLAQKTRTLADFPIRHRGRAYIHAPYRILLELNNEKDLADWKERVEKWCTGRDPNLVTYANSKYKELVDKARMKMDQACRAELNEFKLALKSVEDDPSQYTKSKEQYLINKEDHVESAHCDENTITFAKSRLKQVIEFASGIKRAEEERNAKATFPPVPPITAEPTQVQPTQNQFKRDPRCESTLTDSNHPQGNSSADCDRGKSPKVGQQGPTGTQDTSGTSSGSPVVISSNGAPTNNPSSPSQRRETLGTEPKEDRICGVLYSKRTFSCSIGETCECLVVESKVNKRVQIQFSRNTDNGLSSFPLDPGKTDRDSACTWKSTQSVTYQHCVGFNPTTSSPPRQTETSQQDQSDDYSFQHREDLDRGHDRNSNKDFQYIDWEMCDKMHGTREDTVLVNKRDLNFWKEHPGQPVAWCWLPGMKEERGDNAPRMREKGWLKEEQCKIYMIPATINWRGLKGCYTK